MGSPAPVWCPWAVASLDAVEKVANMPHHTASDASSARKLPVASLVPIQGSGVVGALPAEVEDSKHPMPCHEEKWRCW